MTKLTGLGLLCALSGAVCAVSGCSNTQAEAPLTTDDAVTLAALSQGEDGSDETASDATEAAPLVEHDCGLGAIRKHVIATYDSNGDGKLDASELAAIGDDSDTTGKLGRALGKHLHRAHVMRRHRIEYLRWLYDGNGDGKLDDAERTELQADLEQRCENRKSALLAKYDANGDGTLDDTEWKAAGADLTARFAARKAEVLQKFDENGDGKLDLMERFEARNAIRDRVESKLEAAKKEFDTNGDGKLDADEEQALRDFLKSRVRGEQFVAP